MLQDLVNFRNVSKIFSILNEEEGEHRFVGGCVRNILCGLEVNDVDIATTLKPDKVEELFKSHNIKTLDVGKDHGTIIAIINSFSYEITTLRKDIKTDGRRAIVEYSNDWREDASRRDFTINAMSYCPKNHKLYDYFGGEEDLKKGIVRFVGNPIERVKEDYLRILRFFRFYAYCGKFSNIDLPSLEAFKEEAKNIKDLSSERKLYEFIKILEHSRASDTIILMGKSGVLNHLFESNIGDSVYKMLSMNGLDIDVNLLFRMYIIIEESNIPLEKLVSVFHLSNNMRRYLKGIRRLVHKGIRNIESNIYKYVYEDSEYILDAVVYLVIKENIKKDLFLSDVISLMKKTKEFPVSGQDIISNFHIQQGEEVGRLLELGKDFWYISKYSASKDQVINHLKSCII